MGKVIYSPLVTQVSGSVGGTTFARNASGHSARARTKGVNTRTPKQDTAKHYLSSMAGLWRTMDAGERTSWVVAATSRPYTDTLGHTQHYSGFQLFMYYNLNLVAEEVGDVVCTAPALISFPIWGIDEVVIVVGGSFTFTTFTVNMKKTDVGASSTDLTWLLFATPPMSNGVSRPGRSNFRYVGKSNTFGSAISFSTEMNALFGKVNTGQKIFLYAKLVDFTTGIYIIGADDSEGF